MFGAENDTLIEPSGSDAIPSTVGRRLRATPASRTPAQLGSANVNATANGLANVVIGNAESNVLNGGLGADVLVGGGVTVSSFSTHSAGNVDRITGFLAENYTIRPENAVFKALTVTAVLSASAFAAMPTGGRWMRRIASFKIDTANPSRCDGSGRGAAIQFALVDGRPTVSHVDFP